MSNRNPSLDFLKLGLSFLIVALHIFPVAKLEGIEGLISYEIANGITRIAVPTFFIISGYFLRNKLEDKQYLFKYAKRILLLYVVWQLMYLPDLIRFYHLNRFSSTDALLKLCYGYWHLWYLLATVLAVGLLYFTKQFSVKTKWMLIVSLLIIGYGYQILIQSGALKHYLFITYLYSLIGTTRNFLFMAFPAMLLGTLYDQWKEFFIKIKFLLLPMILVLLLEVGLYYHLKVKAMDFLLFLFPLCMLLFSVFKEWNPTTQFKVNTTMSLGIYLCHPYVIRLVYEFIPQKTFELVVLKYVIICALAVLFWWILDKINKRFPYFL